MKGLASIFVVAALAFGGWWLVNASNRSDSTGDATASPVEPALSPAMIQARVDIFQKAFWRRLGADDQILHAERREWTDADGGEQWQWFLVVEPSAGLVKHLRVDNYLSLSPGSSIEIPPDAPEWFSYEPNKMESLQALNGKMRLSFSEGNALLFATDSGGGFARSVEMPAAAVEPQGSSSGRLPPESPPSPVRP